MYTPNTPSKHPFIHPINTRLYTSLHERYPSMKVAVTAINTAMSLCAAREGEVSGEVSGQVEGEVEGEVGGGPVEPVEAHHKALIEALSVRYEWPVREAEEAKEAKEAKEGEEGEEGTEGTEGTAGLQVVYRDAMEKVRGVYYIKWFIRWFYLVLFRWCGVFYTSNQIILARPLTLIL